MNFDRYLKVDHNEFTIHEFGWDIMNNKLIIPTDTKFVKRKNKIDIYDIGKFVEKINSIRFSLNGKKIINYKYNHSNKWVLYSVNEDYELKILDVIRYDKTRVIKSIYYNINLYKSTIKSSIINDDIYSFTVYQENIPYYKQLLEGIAILNEYNTRIVDWVDRRFQYYDISYDIQAPSPKYVVHDTILGYKILHSIGNQLFIISNEKTEIDPEIEMFNLNNVGVLQDNESFFITIDRTGTIQAILRPKEVIKFMTKYGYYRLELPFYYMNSEIQYTEYDDINTVINKVIEQAREKIDYEIKELIEKSITESEIENFVKQHSNLKITIDNIITTGISKKKALEFLNEYGNDDYILLKDLYYQYTTHLLDKEDIRQILISLIFKDKIGKKEMSRQ